MGSPLGMLLGLVVLAGVIWAILNVAQSDTSNGGKVLWIMLILVLPIVGLIAWFLLGPRGQSRQGA